MAVKPFGQARADRHEDKRNDHDRQREMAKQDREIKYLHEANATVGCRAGQDGFCHIRDEKYSRRDRCCEHESLVRQAISPTDLNVAQNDQRRTDRVEECVNEWERSC